MSLCRSCLLVFACTLWLALFGTAIVLADGPNVINYQGRLTTPAGEPVPNGNYSVVFTIYNQAGSPLWSSGPQMVAVIQGLFSYALGSTTILPDTLFNSTGTTLRYLGIKIGTDPEITPRTLLTSVPFASSAKSVSGDIVTGEGYLGLKKSTGSAGISMELELDESQRGYNAASLVMFDPQPEPPGKLLELRTSASQGPEMKFFNSQSVSSGLMMHMRANPVDGGSIVMYSSGGKAPGGPVLELAGRPDRGGYLVMFDPQPEPPRLLFDLDATSGSGPTMSFFNQAGQVMGVEPSPFIPGFSMKLYNPQTVTPSVLLDMATVFGSTNSATIAMHASSLGGPSAQLVNLSSAMGAGELLLGPGTALKTTGPVVRCYSSTTESRVEIVGPAGGPTATPPISLYSNMLTARVGIGTDAPSQALHVVGNICYTGTIGACSDERYKKDVTTISDALETLLKLRGVTYNWNQGDFPQMKFDDQRHLGFLAQELKDLLPGVVIVDDEGYLSVDYGRLTPLLVEAVKELKTQNDAMLAKTDCIADLESQVADLKAKVEQLLESK